MNVTSGNDKSNGDELDVVPSATEILDINPLLAPSEAVGTMDEVGVTANSRSRRFKRLGKSVLKFVSIQLVVQILSILAGLLLVRHMSKQEYAFYTVANSMQSVVLVLGDSGVTAALSAIGGVIWQDKTRFGQLINTALEFRRKFGLAIGLLVGPLLFWLLHTNGASFGYAIVLTVIVLAGSSFSLIHGILVTVPRFHARVTQLQNADLALAILRLLLIGAASFIFLNAALAVAIFLVTLAVQNVFYRRWAAADADPKAPPNEEDRKEIWRMVRQQAPLGLFACVQGQIFIFLIGIFGKPEDIANIGALGRLTVVSVVIKALMSTVILPRFARAQQKEQVKKMYIAVVLAHLAFCALFMTIIYLFPNAFLILLGSKYAGLGKELNYVAFGASVSIMVPAIYGLNANRGWLEKAWLSIPLVFISQAIMIPFSDLGSIRSVVLLSAIPGIIGMAPLVYRAYYAIRDFGKKV